MGNPCCAGRAHLEKQDSSISSQLEISRQPSKPGKKKSSKAKKKSSKSPKHSEPSKPGNILNNPFSIPQESKEDSSLSYSSDSGSSDSAKSAKSASSASPVSTLSKPGHTAESKSGKDLNLNLNLNPAQASQHMTNDSASGLIYNLLLPKDFSKPQQLQIIAALDSFKSTVPEDEQESVDSLAQVTENGRSKMMMITTHSIFILDPENFSQVDRRVQLEDLDVVVLAKKQDQCLLIVQQEYLENLLFASNKLDDILLAVQQVNYEAFEQYLPWSVLESDGDLKKLASSKKTWPRELKSYQNLSVFKVIVENGKIGELKIAFEQSSCDSDSRVVFFMLTDLAVYSLDKDYRLVARIQLRSIDKVVENKKNKILVLYYDGGVATFNRVLHVKKKIQQESEKLGKKADRWNAQAQLEHLQQKYVGAGNADVSKWEWGSTIKRDSYASHIGHHSRLMFMSLVENESIARTRLSFLTKMIQPCGPPN